MAVTLFAGALWGRLSWSKFWVWDARVTTTAFLFITYVGYLAVRDLGGRHDQRARRSAVVALLAVLSVRPALNLASRHQLMNASFEPFRLVNAYGAFGSVTRRRDEVIIEGSVADHPGPDDWQEYEFRGKPGDVRRRPPQVAPYHLRLDWLMWFIPLGSGGTAWFERLLVRLLEADPATLRLLRRDPFDGVPPRWVRARLLRYRFTTPDERRRSGAWWVRKPVAVLVDPVNRDRLRALGVR
jgi:hypothetical protein